MGVQETGHQDDSSNRTAGEGGKARRIAFYVLLILFALLHVTSPLPYALLGWFLEEGTISHRVHLIVFGWVFVLSLVGLLAQVRRPETKLAQMYQVLISIVLFNAITMIVDRYVDPFVIVILFLPFGLVALHPNRSGLLAPSTHLSKTLMALAVVAAVPLVTDAVVQFQIGVEATRIAAPIFEELENQPNLSDAEFERLFNAAARRVTDSPEQAEEAAHAGHWSAMGAFNLIITGLAVVAAFRPLGWRLPAWSAGLSAALFGLASIANPGDASALNGYWSVFAIAWGIGFIVTAEATRRESKPATVAMPNTA
ncbi:MAG: hypothetical protein ACRDJL_01320 [Actinomycetota bacterium]